MKKYLVKYYHWRYLRAREKMKQYRIAEPGKLDWTITDSGRYYHHERMRIKYGLKWWKHRPTPMFEGAELGLDTTFLDVDRKELSKVMDIDPAIAEQNEKALSADWQHNGKELVFVGDNHTDVTIKYVTVTSKKGTPSTYMVMFRNGVPGYPSWHLLDDKQKKELKEQGIDLD